MNLVFCRIGRPREGSEWSPLIASYLERLSRYVPLKEESFLNEQRFTAALDRKLKPFFLVLLDQRGEQFSSPTLAARIRDLQQAGHPEILLCVGPADGWSQATRTRAGLLLSFGPMTLPHQMATLVLAEQVYRAFTILAGHPYHSGH